MKGGDLGHLISVSTILVLLWLANSGHFSWLLCGLGVASVIFVVWLSHRMRIIDHESQPLHLGTGLPRYIAWLAVEIVKSNMTVVRHIWLGNHSISPCSESHAMAPQTETGRVIYANSITLTPGTVTMNISDNDVLVHALTADTMADLRDGEMGQRVADLED